MKTLAERLRFAMDNAKPKKIRNVDLARAMGVKPPSVSDYLSGKTKSMTGENLLLAAKYLGVDAAWLAGSGLSTRKDLEKSRLVQDEDHYYYLDDDDESVSSGSSTILTVNQSNVDLNSKIQTTSYLPVLSWVQAGHWTESIGKYKEDVLGEFPSPPNAGKRSFYLIVKGMSNYPYFEDGEYICIDPDYSIDEIQTGQMVVVVCNDQATFKALVNEPYKRYLKALNPEWTPNIIELTEDCVLAGKYIGSYRPERIFF